MGIRGLGFKGEGVLEIRAPFFRRNFGVYGVAFMFQKAFCVFRPFLFLWKNSKPWDISGVLFVRTLLFWTFRAAKTSSGSSEDQARGLGLGSTCGFWGFRV